MSEKLEIAHGEEPITVELTLKEALALAGSKFVLNHQLETQAIKKIKRSIENKMLTASGN
ncbi:hypothetical protein ACFFK0_07795 [Paenibacillus chartarius]|uniref:Uncharacterized protein n=1 Tax=Paenibacillus chartarius TaxID=747481 RepID=A0ABV6DIA8_9BACL